MKTCNTVVTYFTPIPELWDPDSQWKLIDVWRRSWQKAGWDTVVLQEADVRSHPRFDFFYEHFNAKPSEYGNLYTNACWLRWLGAHHYGSLRGIPILLSDYDVTNHGFAPLPPWENEMTIFCDEPPVSIFMGAVLAMPHHYLDMCELFAAALPDQSDWNQHAQMFHQDDLSLLCRMFDTKTLPKPSFLRKRPGCSLFDFPGYRTSKLTHWGYAMKQAGFWPKHEWIEKLRPF